MKLITEFIPRTLTSQIEESETGEKELYIEGIFMQGGIKNKNGRFYPDKVLSDAVEKYIKEEVETQGAIGELNHPNNPIPDPDRASHRITKLWKEGKNFMGRALILDTPQGNKVRGLLKGGVRLGVSSRGLGSVKEVDGVNEVQNDFTLKTVDIVSKPSAPDAFVNGIYESAEFGLDGSLIEANASNFVNKLFKKFSDDDLKTALSRAAQDELPFALEKNMRKELKDRGVKESSMIESFLEVMNTFNAKK